MLGFCFLAEHWVVLSLTKMYIKTRSGLQGKLFNLHDFVIQIDTEL